MRVALLLAGLAATVLAGCSGSGPDVQTRLTWRDASHAVLTIRNDGGQAIDMRQHMQDLRMTGPNGTVPMYWGGMDGMADWCWMGPDEQGMHGHMGRGHCGSGMWGGGMMMHASGYMLQPGETWTYQLHGMMANGTWGMMMMPAPASGSWMTHGYGNHMTMMMGDYTCHFAGQQCTARLS